MSAPTIAALPTVPSRANPSTFVALSDAWLTASPIFRAELNALTAYLNDRGEDARAVTLWVTGTNYAEGDVVWSPAAEALYRAKNAVTPSTTDPQSDSTNFASIAGVSAADLVKLGYLTVTKAVNLDDLELGDQFTADGAVSAYEVVVLKSATGKVAGVTPSPTDAPDWIGIASTAGADTEAVHVWTVGDVASGLSGLTIDADYFVGDDGALTISDTGRPIGRAISATELYIREANNG